MESYIYSGVTQDTPPHWMAWEYFSPWGVSSTSSVDTLISKVGLYTPPAQDTELNAPVYTPPAQDTELNAPVYTPPAQDTELNAPVYTRPAHALVII